MLTCGSYFATPERLRSRRKENYTLTVKTPDDLYAKFRVISYYKGNPDVNSQNFINFIRPADRHYTIEYALQKDGSRFFE